MDSNRGESYISTSSGNGDHVHGRYMHAAQVSMVERQCRARLRSSHAPDTSAPRSQTTDMIMLL